jgi:hypothetical protein
VSTAIFLSSIKFAHDERGKVQVATIANIWASNDVMDANPNLAATRAAPPQHARHKLHFELQLIYVGACVH